MGFWSTVGKLAKGAADKMDTASLEVTALAEGFRHEDDDFLKDKLKRGSSTQKLAATKVLKERGYGR